jgi:hypothetical protein
MAHTGTVPTPQTLDEGSAAVYVGYRPSALRAWRIQGRGPAFLRHGRTIRYHLRDLDAWLLSQRVETRDTRMEGR